MTKLKDWQIALVAFRNNKCPKCQHTMDGHGKLGCISTVLPENFRGSVSDSFGGSRGDRCQCTYNPFSAIGETWK